MHFTLEGNDVQALLKKTIQDVESKPLIHVYKGTEVAGVEGYAGNFKVKIAAKDDAKSVIEVGSIVVATGADDLKTTEYLYGQNDKVITQDELEKKIAAGKLGDVKSVAMIQCVGSRDENRPYCSRFCCSQALMNALRIKEMKPEAQVVVFYRDLMSYGSIEKYYTRAREKGVLFVRYEPNSKPEVKSEGGKLKITAKEPALGGKITMEPDLLVLSTPVVPRDEEQLAETIGGGSRRGWFLQGGRGEVPPGGLPQGRYLPVRPGSLAPEPGGIHCPGPGGGSESIVDPLQGQADLREDGLRGQAEVVCRMRDVHHRLPLRRQDQRRERRRGGGAGGAVPGLWSLCGRLPQWSSRPARSQRQAGVLHDGRGIVDIGPSGRLGSVGQQERWF